MSPSIRKMWLCSVVASCLVAMTTAAGNEYLPPSKGYNYEPPKTPLTLPTNGNGVKQPTPGPFRPPSRPTNGYIPPGPTPPVGRPTPPVVRPTPPPQHDHPHPDGGHDHDHGDHHHHEPGMPFDFAYTVNEDGNDYSHNAISDGDVTRGEYRVALPDGRTQIVKYTADWKNGFNAEVSYEGEARYPDQPTGGYGSGPASGPGQSYVPPSQGGGYQY